MIQLLSSTNYGDLTIAIDGDRYTYFGVSPWIQKDVERRIKHGQVGKIMGLLGKFSRTDLFKEEDSMEKQDASVEAGKVAHLEGEVERLTRQRDAANELYNEAKIDRDRYRLMLKTAQGQIQILEEKRITPQPSEEIIQGIEDALAEEGGEDIG